MFSALSFAQLVPIEVEVVFTYLNGGVGMMVPNELFYLDVL